MAKFTAHKASQTVGLLLDLIGNGDDFLAYQDSPADSTPDFVKYFASLGDAVAFTLHGGLSDLLVSANFPANMTVTGVEFFAEGKLRYEITDCSFQLGDVYDNWDGIEEAIFIGNDRIRGSTGNDRLVGFDGDDVIKGGKGRDIVAGGDGVNKLIGGKGSDQFAFIVLEASDLADRVVDYEHADRLLLYGTPFEILEYRSDDGTLKSGMFHIGKNARDANDHVIYNEHTGALYFDEDGVGGIPKWKLAVLDHRPDVSARDFLMFPIDI